MDFFSEEAYIYARVYTEHLESLFPVFHHNCLQSLQVCSMMQVSFFKSYHFEKVHAQCSDS